MNKKRIKGADFVRAISAIGIVIHHFSCTIEATGKGSVLPLNTYANGNWGGLFVTVFFILSGAMLYYNYSEIKNLKTYYFKRWKGLFPMFYLAYIIFCIPYIVKYGTVFYKGSPFAYILTLLGMDGYFSYKTTTYYVLGEWFLGAIILLYILYPVLLKLLKKPWISTAFLVALYIWQVYSKIFEINSMRNLISCVISFWLGMLFMKYYEVIEKKKWIVSGISLAGLLIMLFIKVPLETNIAIHVAGVFTFLVLLFIGNIIMEKPSKITVVISEVSLISYAIFLVHHELLYKIISYFKGLYLGKTVVLLIASLAICIIAAYVIYYLNKIVFNSVGKFYKIIHKQ